MLGPIVSARAVAKLQIVDHGRHKMLYAYLELAGDNSQEGASGSAHLHIKCVRLKLQVPPQSLKKNKNRIDRRTKQHAKTRRAGSAMFSSSIRPHPRGSPGIPSRRHKRQHLRVGRTGACIKCWRCSTIKVGSVGRRKQNDSYSYSSFFLFEERLARTAKKCGGQKVLTGQDIL